MSYWMEQVAEDFFIPYQYKEAALAALQLLVAEADEGYGPWVEKRIREAQTLTDALLMESLRVREDDEGNIIDIRYVGYTDNRYGLQHLFEAITPYVRAGSYIVMHREAFEGHYYKIRWNFTGEYLVEDEQILPYKSADSAADRASYAKHSQGKKKRSAP